MSDQRLPPVLMVRSFLTIASGFVLFVTGFMTLAAILGYLFFPEYIEFLNEPDIAVQREVMANNPEQAIPRNMFLLMLVGNALFCGLLGIYAFFASPFSHFAHVIFLAGLLFVFFLQTANADPAGKKSMTLIYLFVFPVSVLVGGKIADSWALKRYQRQQESGDEENSTKEI
ncbi:MAG: hypothetical protein AAF939_03150 [Planctomycetota bacterium]